MKTNYIEMKTYLKNLLLIAILASFLYACDDNKKPVRGEKATIVFDSRSSTAVNSDGTFRVFGEITSPEGIAIKSIVGSCVYKYDGKTGSKVFTDDSPECVIKETDNYYKFEVTESAGVAFAYLDALTHIKMDVTTENGEVATKAFEIKSSGTGNSGGGPIDADDPIFTNGKNFEWVVKLLNPNDTTGMEKYGLKWDGINPEGFLVIKPRNQLLSKFVELNDSVWEDVIFKETFLEIVAESEHLSSYEKIKAEEAEETYSEVLGLIYKDKPYLFRITESTSRYGVLTIKGKFKQ